MDIFLDVSDEFLNKMNLFCVNSLAADKDEFLKKPDLGRKLSEEARKIIGLPAIDTANHELHPRVFNIIIMGAVIGLTKVVTFEAAKNALEKKLAYKFEKSPELKELNFKALEIGKKMAEESLQEGGAGNE